MTSLTSNTLWAAVPTAFDLEGASSRVTMHMTVLNPLDTVWIPGAQNAALDANREAERMTVANHLAEAQALVGALTGDGGVDAAVRN